MPQNHQYDHSRKAGNRGDVWKHAVLVSVADLIPIAADDFHYVDSHAGAPVHELLPGGEWERGVGAACLKASSDSPYFAIAAEYLRSQRYPAGWVFATRRLARRCHHVHAVLSDTADDIAAKYSQVLPSEMGIPPNVVFSFQQADGFDVARSVQQADLVFLDPPFRPDADADWRALAATCRHLAQGGLAFLAWYPFYWPTQPQKLVDATACSGWEVTWAPCGRAPSQNLKGCGMLVSPQLGPLLNRAEAELREVSGSLGAELFVRQPKTA